MGRMPMLHRAFLTPPSVCTTTGCVASARANFFMLLFAAAQPINASRALLPAAPGGEFLFQNLIFDKLGLGTPGVVGTVIFDILAILLVFTPAVMVFAMFAIWWERKVAGHMQSRLGPNRVGPYGILPSLADGIKLLTKGSF